MSCTVELSDLHTAPIDAQRMLAEVLINYGNMAPLRLADTIGVSMQTLEGLCQGVHHLSTGETADLIQLFLLFFGKTFFKHCSIIRQFD